MYKMSTDNSGLNLPMHTALTSDMMYGLKPSAPKSRSYRQNIAPSNASSFAASSTMIFDIPTGRAGTYLDTSLTYLKFSVQVTSTAAAPANPYSTGVFVENSAYSFIQRMDIFHASNLLESCNEYGQLANYLIDNSISKADKAAMSAMIGTNPYTTTALTGVADVLGVENVTMSTAGDRSGLPLPTATTIAAATPMTFCLPVLSGVIGCSTGKMIPTKDLTAPINTQFYLSSNDDAIFYGLAGAGAAWTISNAELICTFVEIQDDVVSKVDSRVPQYIGSQTWRQVSTYIPSATSGEITSLIGLRCSSLTGVYARFRPYSNAVQGATATAAYRKSASINPNIGSYYLRVGSQVVPQKPVYLLNTNVGCGAEGYIEVAKSFHALASSVCRSSIDYQNYNVAATTTYGWSAAQAGNALVAKNLTTLTNGIPNLDTSSYAFSIAFELQSFSNRSDTILSGISTLNAPLFLSTNIYSGLTAGGASGFNYVCDVFGSMDMILVIQDGIMSAKF